MSTVENSEHRRSGSPRWLAITPSPRPPEGELTFFARDGSVVFGDVVVIYTSNQTTIPIQV